MRPDDAPILVIDFENTAELPELFRTTRDEYQTDVSPPITRFGLDRVNASATRQFSELDLVTSLNHMSGNHMSGNHMSGRVFVVDLRQESHGFADGTAVSWYGFLNDSNLGKTRQEIADLEQALVDDIAARTSVQLNRIVRKTNGHIEKSSSCEVRLQRAETERTLVERVGLEYVRLPVTDHRHPDPPTVDQFVDFVGSLPGDAWVHFHCRSGKGRSSTFMVLIDIFHNAGAVSLEDIIRRNALIGSKDFSRVSNLRHKVWKNEMAKNRHHFLVNFYSYMTDSDGYGRSPWSEWLARPANGVR
jgi:protein tyrosine phosphatase (PTP) superfamily phosphohydrolase (DUF442 family)